MEVRWSWKGSAACEGVIMMELIFALVDRVMKNTFTLVT